MDVRAEKNDIDRRTQEISQGVQSVDQDLNSMDNRIERLNQSKDTKLDNVRTVKGEGFDESPEHMAILAEIESTKSQFLLNAIS